MLKNSYSKMKLTDKNILLISPEPWEHLFVSKHHYACELAKFNNRVYFLNPPSDRYKLSQTTIPGLYQVDYKGFIKGLRYLPSMLRHYLTRKKFTKIEHLCDCTFDLIWSFDNSVFYDFDALRSETICISHIVDLNQDFQTTKAASSADVCLGVIPEIVTRLKRHNHNTHLITHGVQDFHYITKTALPGRNTIKALYTGNLLMKHIRWDIIRKCVEQNPHVDFIFYGAGENKETVALGTLQNAYFPGPVPSEQVPSLLSSADLLLLAYDSSYENTYASPHKMMEYLASGKIICSTPLKEYKDLDDKAIIKMSADPDSFPSVVTSTVSGIHYWNSPEKQKLRKDLVADNSYKKQDIVY